MINKHDFESKIIGHHDQVEPKWVTSFGYRKPIMEYTCKNCGKIINDKITPLGMMFYIFETDECKGNHNGQ